MDLRSISRCNSGKFPYLFSAIVLCSWPPFLVWFHCCQDRDHFRKGCQEQTKIARSKWNMFQHIKWNCQKKKDTYLYNNIDQADSERREHMSGYSNVDKCILYSVCIVVCNLCKCRAELALSDNLTVFYSLKMIYCYFVAVFVVTNSVL